jgi:Uma2 family endonuclease
MCSPPETFSREATEADLEDLPEDRIGHLVDGELIVHPRPDAPHTEAATQLVWSLVGPLQHGLGGPGGWVILSEPKVRFERGILVPDLAGWRRERFASPRKGPYTVAPDWVCEILSPSTARFDRATKLPIYAEARVEHAWLLDPAARFLEVLRRQETRWLIAGVFEGRRTVRAEPFETLDLDLARIWGAEPVDPAAADSFP